MVDLFLQQNKINILFYFIYQNVFYNMTVLVDTHRDPIAIAGVLVNYWVYVVDVTLFTSELTTKSQAVKMLFSGWFTAEL